MLGPTLKSGQETECQLFGRHAYLVPAKGTVAVNGIAAAAGDGVAIADERVIHVSASEDAEFVLVDTV